MEYKDLPDAQKSMLCACIMRDEPSEFLPGTWAEIVGLAETDEAFRCACLGLNCTQEAGLLLALQAICRSVDARIACLDALA